MSETLGGFFNAIQRIVLENTIDGGLTWGSLWTAAEVHNYLNQRTARFLLETEIMQHFTTLNIGAGTGTFDLPTDLIVLKRIAASPDGVTFKSLIPVDRWQTDGINDNLTSDEDRPVAYILEPLKPLQIVVLPTPTGSMQYKIVYIKNAATLTPATSRLTVLQVIDTFVPYLMFGVLSDMFSKEGEANDPDRAEYFEQRWNEGIELAKLVVR